jgi:hypothetical protein
LTAADPESIFYNTHSLRGCHTESMMTAAQFRRIALGLPETEERAHMSHPDFRVAGKIFATLGYPREGWAMVKLTPEQQQEFMHDAPRVFVPVKGAWGKSGCTNVVLNQAGTAVVRQALLAAWHNNAPKSVARCFEAEKQQVEKGTVARSSARRKTKPARKIARLTK